MKMRKVFDREDIISWSNSENAKKYVEQQGYFGNSFQDLVENVNNNTTSILCNVFKANEVHCIFEDVHDIRYGLFLPIDKVKGIVEPKRWRPFKNIDEFKRETGLGLLSIVRYRYTIGEPRIITTTGVGVITEFSTCCGTYYITIGDTLFMMNI